MLKILIAPSALKGTISPVKVAEAIQAGVNDSDLDCQLELAPLADGGDGTLESLHFALGGSFEHVDCHGPLGAVHKASWLQLPGLAIVELASACGLALLQGQKLEPLLAHTLGLGEVIHDCFNKGQGNIVVTLGGSASTDGGTGALKALGALFYGKDKQQLPLGGGVLERLDSCDLTLVNQALLKQNVQSIRVAVDVKNPLLGANGAACIFAPQKGAQEEEVEKLERGLTRLADVLENAQNRRIRDVAGTGAAGGTAFGLMLGLNAELISGFHWIANLLNLEKKIQWADLIITAEGKFDSQSLSGKATGELGLLCKKFGRNLVVIAGGVDQSSSLSGNLNDLGITEVRGVAGQWTLAGSKDIQKAAADIVSSYRP